MGLKGLLQDIYQNEDIGGLIFTCRFRCGSHGAQLRAK